MSNQENLTTEQRLPGVTDSELMSMIAWFEGDARPAPDKITRGHMARALRELQDRRDADDRRLGLRRPYEPIGFPGLRNGK